MIVADMLIDILFREAESVREIVAVFERVLPHFKRKKGEDILPDKIPVYHCKVERDDAIGKRGGIRMSSDDPAGKGVRVG